ncbi:MAG TPA: TonB-dependent receptor [Puia sp.]|uniref:TonB-dependent receptor domain-containing protein n=1 Tax=Puia sp. TaxID=2045100 RepID=UPI002C6B6C62|nr:TonB-dependent receptor [Puia sp.]HVU94497.1 TonB-dependent receptor [Puia sp.]
MKVNRILFIFFFAVCCSARAQDAGYLLKGRVRESADRPIGNASILLQKQGNASYHKETVSDTAGYFSVIADGGAGVYVINVTAIGYRPFTLDSLSLPSPGNQETKLAVLLSQEASSLAAVVVTSRRLVVSQKIDMQVVTVPPDLRTEIPNVLELLKIVPGVSVSENEDKVAMSGKEKVDIMINGKITRMDIKDVLKLLKAIPSSSLQGLEVISNPSARYDVSGNTGILNIRIRKNASGLTGNYTANLSQAIHPGGSTSLSLDYGAKKFNVNGYAGYNFGKYRTTIDENRTVVQPGYSQYFTTGSRNDEQWQDPDLRLTADYTVSPKSTLGAIVEIEKGINKIFYDATNSIASTPGGKPDTSYGSHSVTPYTRHWDSYNLNYEFADTMGRDLNINFDYSYYSNDKTNTIQNFLTYPDNGSEIDGNTYHNLAHMNIYTLKVDYVKSYGNNGKVEFGYKYSDAENRNNLRTLDFSGSSPLLDSAQTNDYDYREYIHSGYINYGVKAGKWGFQAGARYEHSQIKGVFANIAGSHVNKPDSAYANLLPSVFITFAPNDDHSFRLSGTQRIKRPDYEDLEPFSYQLDQFSYTSGNPYLIPQKNTNVELNYAYKGSLDVTAGYVYTQHFFNSLIHQEGDIRYYTIENTGVRKEFTFTASYPVQVTKWWVSRNKVTAAYNYFNGALFQGYLVKDGWGGQVSSSQRFKLSKDYLFILSTWYNFGNTNLIYKTAGYGNVTVAVSRKLFGDRGSLRVGFSDIFKTQQERTTVNFDGLKYVDLKKWESRSVFLEFTCKIGRSPARTVRDRETGNSDEKDRSKH